MHVLVMLHATLGEIGALAFLWVFVELLSPSESRIRRATMAAGIGTLLFIASWIAGGLNYLDLYQSSVKGVIKAGPTPWAHSIVTETKEHVFLFIPFLAVVAWTILKQYGSGLLSDKGARIAIILIAGLLVLMAFAMAGMGVMISSGYRAALEAKL